MRRLACIVIVVSAVFGLLPDFAARTEASAPRKAVIVVKATPESDLASSIEFKNVGALERAIRGEVSVPMAEAPASDAYLMMEKDGTRTEYVVYPGGQLYDIRARAKINLNRKIRTVLLSYVDRLREKHYGNPVHWEEADRIIPRKSVIKVTDIETGLSFEGQRRAGRRHADVQPLTAADTAVMKKIYEGKWSWNRKAIIVETDGRRFAASMNGMPHGGDGIPGNQFSGHFCIHFRGSSTHGSGNVDPMHQLMVYKAAGRLEPYFASMSPNQTIDTFFAALNMGELHVLRMLFTRTDNESLAYFLEKQPRLASISGEPEGAEADLSGELSAELPYDVRIAWERGGKERAAYVFHMKRLAYTQAWKIERVELKE
ncbi:hypothetical protein [Paenibacillus thermotolerans]|uniref:hypothetical protein n=1 Tax=Paenibacillus thermotolerans TaxID=3027807 RepID=UPI002368E25D|nr:MULTISPECIES: hypothetical protein [unclassified Paenibacillus]